MNRREFLRTAGGAAGTATTASAVSGSATAQEGGGGGNNSSSGSGGNNSSGGGGSASGPINYDGWLDDVGNFSDKTAKKMGSNEVTIKVGVEANGGSNGFAPPAVHVAPGTKIIWEWTGNGSHNVVGENKDFKSGSATTSGTFEKTFEESGVVKYLCEPHESMGMKGAVAVGEVPRKSPAAAQEVEPEEMGVPIQPHFVGVAAVLMMMSTLVFTFYQLKYGESANTKGGNN